jgi:hypothetical protein
MGDSEITSVLEGCGIIKRIFRRLSQDFPQSIDLGHDALVVRQEGRGENAMFIHAL